MTTDTPPSSSATLEAPLISVIIATRNRCTLLLQSLHSVLNQTYKNLEVIVIDDGSTDDTESAVTSHPDPRVRYVKREWGGISAARNTGTQHARGEWIAVHDDDDLMTPERLVDQVAQISDDVDFIYGAFVNFDDDTGELQLHHGRNYGFGAALMTGFAPGHSTWLVRTETMRAFPYDEGLASAVDNNLTFRMLRSGVRFLHSGVVCVLRRVHSGRITNTGGGGQKYVAQLNQKYLQAGIPKKLVNDLWKDARYSWGPVDKSSWQSRHRLYLPDHLVRRSGLVRTISHDDSAPPQAEVTLVCEARDAADLSWEMFIEHVGRGADASAVHVRLREPEQIEHLLAKSDQTPTNPDRASGGAQLLIRHLEPHHLADFVVLATARTAAWTDEALALTVGTCRIAGDFEETLTGAIVVRSLEGADALRRGPLMWAESCRVVSARSVDQVTDSLRQVAPAKPVNH